LGLIKWNYESVEIQAKIIYTRDHGDEIRRNGPRVNNFRRGLKIESICST